MEITRMKDAVMKFLRDEEGASGIEYALVAAMVAIAIVAFVPTVNTAVSGIFESIRDALTENTPE